MPMEDGIKIVQKFHAKFFLATVACLALLVSCRARKASRAKSWPKPKVPNEHVKVSKDTETKIRTVLIMSNKNVYDYNNDGEVVCVDHAVLFKIYWDKYYNKDDCIIVRNANRATDMHHLFCAVYDKPQGRFVMVETWDANLKRGSWCMHCVWGDEYDAYYDRYDETEYWLGGGVYDPKWLESQMDMFWQEDW